MAVEGEPPRRLHQQINDLQASRNQQLQLNGERAQAEGALRRRAAETTLGLIKLNAVMTVA